MEFLDKTVTEDFTVIEPIQCSHELKLTPWRETTDCHTHNKS